MTSSPTTIADHVVAPDGTRIGFWTSGDGPPVVMVHGAMADHTTLDRVVPLLAPHVTVHAVDRRGRGISDDGPDYAIEREYDDLAAVAAAVAARAGGPVTLYGHSYGATCALGTALRSPDVARLALYEPAFAGTAHHPAPLLDRLEELVVRGEREAAVETTLREVLEVPEADVAAMRALPSWSARVGAAPTIPRELRTATARILDPASYAHLAMPTLLLDGERSPAGQRAVVATLAGALPAARVAVLPGQGHLAQVTAPELVAGAVLDLALGP
ncbi:alpha/beta hydrolase [Pseudonocardia yuanmonensis]|uniref:Alpha/beta hydrolase n=1 Tax=Pseudonocardia yuanmonensis TaxID=1095914 RepID=A0ABP8VWV4_9PSEU